MVIKLWVLAFWISSIVCDVVPTLNLESLGGELGFIGDYAGLSPFKSFSQFESLPNNNNTTGIVLNDGGNDIYTLFATVNGTIETYCQLTDTQYILAGNFDTINSTTYNHIAQFDTTTSRFTPLGQGVDGPVRSLYCTNNQSVYVGGDFTAPKLDNNVTAYTGHIALWQNNQWSPVPWKGFNGPVYSIIPHPQQQSILFAGRFDSTGDGKFASLNTSQSINLASSAIISGGNSALSGNNSDPAGVICSKSPWLLQSGVPGYWEAQFGSSNAPSVFRISNTHLADKGTNEFNIIALGSNQYFELSYRNPITDEMVSCSEKCFLSNDTSIPYQDFTITNNLTASALRININSWYGTGGGLGGVDIFTSDVSLQPQLSSNSESAPSGCSESSSSSATATGDWKEVYSYQTYENFLIATFPSNQLQQNTPDLSVTYKPFIPVQEVYNVYVTTPGCVGTSTCNQRSQVALDVSMMPGNTSTPVLDQRNTADNRSLIYTGPIAASSDAFQPSVILRIAPDAIAPANTVSIVAASIQFMRNTTSAKLSSILNYYPSNNTWVPLLQQLPLNATVRTLQSLDSQVFIGGQFTMNGSYSNIVSYDFNQNGYQPLSNVGLNGAVSSSVLVGSQLVVGGRFTGTADQQLNMSNVATYDVQAKTWTSMTEGVNDSVDHIYTTSNNDVHVSGAFTSAGGSPAYKNAQWNLSSRSWVPSSSFIYGSVTNQIAVSANKTLYFGAIKSAQSYRANHVTSLTFTSGSEKQQQWLSQITNADPNAVVTSGVVWKNQSDPVMVLGGLFHLNNTQYHIAYQNTDGSWVGLLNNIQGDITTLYVVQNLLFIGGQFNGTLDNSSSQAISFAIYDFSKQAFQDVQGLTTSDGKPGQINIIRPQADGKNVFVAGNFALAGLLNCNSICKLASDSRQWSPLNGDIQGNIRDIAVYNGAVIAVGEFTVGSSPSGMAVLENFDSNGAAWKSVSNMNLTHILNDGTGHYLVSGMSDQRQSYLASWDGKTLTTMDAAISGLGPSSNIRQVTYVPVSSSPSTARYPKDSDQVLLAVGHLDVPNFGSCSAALFDGQTWYPYLLTSSKNGTSGSIQSSFTTTPCCTFEHDRKYLSVPAVILVSIAISLGIIFLCIALAFIFILFKRRGRNEHQVVDPMQEWKPKYRPHSLLALLDAAHLSDSAIFTTSAVGGAGAGAAAAASASRDDHTTGYTTAFDARGQQSMDLTDNPSSRLRNSSGFSAAGGSAMIPFSVMMANALKSNNNDQVAASEESPKVYYAKYPFEAKEFGELAFDAHAPIIVTDTSDNVWWMGYKDDGSNHPVSGLFPSNYVSRAKPF